MKKIRTLTIQNKGQFNFEFNFTRKNQFDEESVQILPDRGTVEAGSTKEVQIILHPRDTSFSRSEIELEIISGPRFCIKLEANVKKPNIRFNTHKFDFGLCAVTKNPVPTTKSLLITNNDSMTMQVESSFIRKPYLNVDIVPGVSILPGSTLEIPITFVPNESRKY